MTELILQTDLTEEQREYVSIARTSAETLMGIINDVLDFSKIEAKKLDLSPAPFRLGDILDQTMRTMALRAHQKSLELICDVRSDVPEALIGDEVRLRQVLLNLASNAVKFTERGEVILRVEALEKGPEAATLRFTVSDTGVGIAPEKLHSIFEAFVQADGSVSRKYGGTGLGLTISTNLVGLMGGSMTVESEPGCGSRFQFTLRLPIAAPAPDKSALEAFCGRRALVVDDNASCRDVLAEEVRSWGMEVTVAADAAEAIECIREACRTGCKYDLAVIDSQMPHVDGFAAAERARAENTAVIMLLTVRDLQRGLECCRRIGAAAYVIKPAGSRDLLRAAALALNAQSPEASGLRRVNRPLNARVLLAEDHPINQLVVRRMLEQRGCAVAVAGDGHEAVRAYQEGDYDVILMDVQMPGLDGLQAAAKIREAERQTGKVVPIIGLTAHALAGDRKRCLDAGMDDYLTKPLRGEELITAIERLVRARE